VSPATVATRRSLSGALGPRRRRRALPLPSRPEQHLPPLSLYTASASSGPATAYQPAPSPSISVVSTCDGGRGGRSSSTSSPNPPCCARLWWAPCAAAPTACPASATCRSRAAPSALTASPASTPHAWVPSPVTPATSAASVRALRVPPMPWCAYARVRAAGAGSVVVVTAAGHRVPCRP
jgi:hypothetical protein